MARDDGRPVTWIRESGHLGSQRDVNRRIAMSDEVVPRFGGQSLFNVPPTICDALGASTDGLGPLLDSSTLPPAMTDDVATVVLLLVDGLGREQLDTAVSSGQTPTLAALVDKAASGASDVSLTTITSVFPSSTMPALATLHTGLSPAVHGQLGWTVYLEEFGDVAELARWGPANRRGSYQDPELGGHDPIDFFGRDTIHQRLARAGVRSVAICPAAFRRSGLSRMLFQGAEQLGYHATSSVPVMAEQLLSERRAGDRMYLYVYWPTVDTVGHHHGPLAEEHSAELATLDFSLGRWLRIHERRGDLLVLITADHGHVSSEPSGMVRLDHPDLLSQLIAPPSGERRLAYLHPRAGRESAVRELCGEYFGDSTVQLDSSLAFDRGLFGPGPASAMARRRAGVLMLLARGEAQLVSPLPEHEPEPLLGNHGGLAPREMLVPLLALRL